SWWKVDMEDFGVGVLAEAGGGVVNLILMWMGSDLVFVLMPRMHGREYPPLQPHRNPFKYRLLRRLTGGKLINCGGKRWEGEQEAKGLALAGRVGRSGARSTQPLAGGQVMGLKSRRFDAFFVLYCLGKLLGMVDC